MTHDHDVDDSWYTLNPNATATLRALDSQMKQAPPRPAAGQLWRATWVDTSALVAVLSIDGMWAQVAPVTVDIKYADPFTVVLNDDASPLPVSVAVFAGLTTPLPLFTLDAGIGSIDSGMLETLHTLHAANLQGELPDVDADTGTCDVDALDIRREFRVELSNTLAQLAKADLSVLTQPSAIDIETELRAHSIGPTDLRRILSVDLSQARQIATGVRPLSAAQAGILAPLLQRSPSELEANGKALDSDLVSVLHDPYEFGVVRLLARRDDVPELVAARTLPTQIAARSSTQHSADEGQRFWRDALAVLRRSLTNGH